ncbi:hypothetical protein [Brevundimonas sp.]|jgi:hypothetical protein|uniref:hypothetical protein n=1 Tax=Brevundimonas sp. TaxID=1871086 RepID=UPI0037841BFD
MPSSQTFIRFAAFGGLVLSLLAGPTHAQGRQLPAGPYTLFAGNGASANFIVENSVSPSGDRVRLSTYRIYAQGVPLSRGVMDQELNEIEINCAARTWHLFGSHGFSPNGDWISSLPAEPETAIQPNQTWDFVAKLVCGEARMPASATVQGPAAARALGLSRLRGS